MNDPTVQMMNQLQHPPPPQQQQIMNHQSQQQMMMMNQPPSLPPVTSSQMMFGVWIPPPQIVHPDPNVKVNVPIGGFGSGSVQNQVETKNLGPRNNWKGKRVRSKDNVALALASGVGSAGGGYQTPTLNELLHQNRVKAKGNRCKKYNPHFHTNSNNNNNNSGRNMGKFAPRNTTSFLIRAKKSGGIAELVSPYPVTPAVLPTPMFSPSREVLVDMAKEEWGVDGYGSMKGLIRLRSPGREDDGDEDDDDEAESSESDVEDHVEVERRLDHDLSRFEMIYPNNAGGMDFHNVLENRVDDQDTHIAHLEEENLILKERLFLMDRELGDLRRRLRYLERLNHGGGGGIQEEVLENETDSESDSRGESRKRINPEEFVEENTECDRDVKMGEEFEGVLKGSKGNDENVTVKEETDVDNVREGMLVKRLKNAVDASLDNSVELKSMIDMDDYIPLEREVSNENDECVTEKLDQASGLMNEAPENNLQLKDDKTVKELAGITDARLDMLSMGGERKEDADYDIIPKIKGTR